ncbi:hypothetical protein [Holdemanella porci]|uniref:hypothetical protein n=1 Tax=Holdemanella porci TaxID=2652276 RepID=UPI002943583B|nr:hypothetical protein [Holdemanella porci]
MNKYKKALNKIGDTLTYYMVRKDLNQLPSDNEIFDSMDTLRELVERATPKKPEIKELIRKDNYRDGTNIPRYDWWCPNCNLEHMSGNDFKYCPSCGQALDWSEDE